MPVDAYLAPFPPAVRERLESLRATIRQALTDGGAASIEETISYGIPTFDVAGKHVVHIAGFAKHVGFYPGRTLEEFAADFEGFKQGRGSVQFPFTKPMPLEAVRRVTQKRLEEVLGSGASPGRDQHVRATRGT